MNPLLNAGAVPGRIMPGYLADRFGTFNTIIITAGACTALIFGLWLPSGGNTAAVAAFSVLYGFWSGAAISLTPVSIGAICDVEDYGKRIGTAYCISSFGALTGIPIAGAILEASGGSYGGLISFAGGLYAAAMGAYVVARGVAGGWSLRTRV
jgi:MFS family permease